MLRSHQSVFSDKKSESVAQEGFFLKATCNPALVLILPQIRRIACGVQSRHERRFDRHDDKQIQS